MLSGKINIRGTEILVSRLNLITETSALIN